MRIVLLSATQFGHRCLEAVAALPGCEISGIVTVPETFPISHSPQGVRNVLHADFRPAAERLGAPLHVMRGRMTDEEVMAHFCEWRPDLTLVAGWYHLVPRAIRDIAPAIGLHASLLPDYAGGAPLVWAMINGERKTGITLFRLDDGVDSGPIIGQAEEPIHDDDTIASLYARIEDRGVELLQRHLPRLASGTVDYRTPDPTARRVFPQRQPEDGRIDWRWPAPRIYNFVRAQTRPYPGAFADTAAGRLKIWSARAVRDDAAKMHGPGTLLPARDGDQGVRVACGEASALELLSVGTGDESVSAALWFRRSGVSRFS